MSARRTTDRRAPRATLATLATLATALGPATASPRPDGELVLSTLRFDPEGEQVVLRDLTGDGRREVVVLGDAGLRVHRMGDDGAYGPEPVARLAWPTGRVAWDVADLDGAGGAEVLFLVDGTRLVAHDLTPEGFSEARDVLTGEAYLPAGISRMPFARDVDGDGHLDLVLPGIGRHRIHLWTEAGWRDPIEVEFEPYLEHLTGNATRLDGRFGQLLAIPWFRLEDVDGDGTQDLVSQTEERVAFHLALPELSTRPTWVLDLVALEAELPKREGIDLDDLLSNVTDRIDWRLADLDGEAPRDLIVSLGPRLRMYLGGARTGPDDTPDQVLQSSGNVLWFLVRQAEGSPLPDLQLVRGEKIGLGRVLRYLILPGRIDFDLFTYRNEGGSFSRRPTRRNRIGFEIPRLLSLMDDADGLGAAIDAQFDIPARRLSGGPGEDDVVDIVENQLLVFEGCAPARSFEEEILDGQFDLDVFIEGFLLDDLDRRGDGAETVLDLGDLKTYEFAPGLALRRACAGHSPVFREALTGGDQHQLATRDLDGDGRLDVVCVTETEDGWDVRFLVRR